MYFFAEFPSCVTEKPAYAGSVILDCMLSLDSGLITDYSGFVLRSIYSILILFKVTKIATFFS